MKELMHKAIAELEERVVDVNRNRKVFFEECATLSTLITEAEQDSRGALVRLAKGKMSLGDFRDAKRAHKAAKRAKRHMIDMGKKLDAMITDSQKRIDAIIRECVSTNFDGKAEALIRLRKLNEDLSKARPQRHEVTGARA